MPACACDSSAFLSQASGGEWNKDLLFNVPREHGEMQRLEGRYGKYARSPFACFHSIMATISQHVLYLADRHQYVDVDAAFVCCILENARLVLVPATRILPAASLHNSLMLSVL